MSFFDTNCFIGRNSELERLIYAADALRQPFSTVNEKRMLRNGAYEGTKGDVSAASSLESESKRYLPEHKKPGAALTFPEKLMKMMRYAEKQGDDFCVAWMKEGDSFIIRDSAFFTDDVVPKFFKATKFSSFTRKLYRWGFRQINRGTSPNDPIIFGNEFFQRGNPELMVKMRSTTAGSARAYTDDIYKDIQSSYNSSPKRSADELAGHDTVAQVWGSGASVNQHGLVPSLGLEEPASKRQRVSITEQVRQETPAVFSYANPSCDLPFNVDSQLTLAEAIQHSFSSSCGYHGMNAMHTPQPETRFSNYIPYSDIRQSTDVSSAEIISAALAALRYG